MTGMEQRYRAVLIGSYVDAAGYVALWFAWSSEAIQCSEGHEGGEKNP